MNWGQFLCTRPVAMATGKSWRRMHSPLLFRLAKALQSNPIHWPDDVLVEESKPSLDALRALRHGFRSGTETVLQHDHGAGPRRGRHHSRRTTRIADVARDSLTNEHDAEALVRFLRALSPRGRVLELGTSLGVMAAHLTRSGWEVETWEGCPNTRDLALKGWAQLKLGHSINSKLGTFRELLTQLGPDDEWDVVYLDGHHDEVETLHLAKALSARIRVALVVDDIAWSAGMHRAWLELRQWEEWRVSISWRGRGLLLRAPHMAEQHVRLA